LRWVVGLVVLGGLGLLAATAGRNYVTQFTAQTPAAVTSDPRIEKLLDSAARQYALGDLEGAKADFDKASVLAEKDPGVALGLARIEAARADRVWLKLRLLAADDTERANLSSELRSRAAKLQAALSSAKALAPHDNRTVELQIDLLRIEGKVGEARGHAGGLSSSAGSPDTAYALAALDVADTSPSWPTVLQRLETAMAGDRGVGRAHALWIYALAESGDVAGARRELGQLAGTGPAGSPHPLLDSLRAFILRKEAETGAPDATAGMGGATGAGGAPSAAGSATEVTGNSEASGFQGLLERASAARRAGENDRAERLYEEVLAVQPSNVEALSGLADIARRRGQTATAESYYERVLANNPGFLPALIGAADIKWAGGDRAGAVRLYRRVGPDTMYSERAEQRIAQFQAGGSEQGGNTETRPTPESPPPTAAEPSPAEPSPPAPTSTQPKLPGGSAYPDRAEIDTTDLPDY
jgi:tetratricopeptide (TPR) repeat protein